jgi:hypothetical protein
LSDGSKWRFALARGRVALGWVARRAPELAALLAGVALRVSMAETYDARLGFDFGAHWGYVQSLVQQGRLPAWDLSAASYQPPLYYGLAGLLGRAGLDVGGLAWLGAVLGTVRLVITWMALERWLPGSRLARVVALWTAALIPAAVQMDGMVANETLSTLFCAGAILAAPAAVEGARRGSAGPAIKLAAWLALALVTKPSGMVLLVAALMAFGIDAWRRGEAWLPALRRRARPLVAGAATLVVLSGWSFARSRAVSGKLVPTSYDGFAKGVQAPYESTPYLDRRTVGFFVGWDSSVVKEPYFPKGYYPHARFFPILIASTFCDYYRFNFAGNATIRGRAIPPPLARWSTLSVAGGTVIALLTALAWLGAARTLWRRPEDPRLVLLLIPLLALLGQLHFAVRYPNDSWGPIKGTYLQFVAPVLCGLYGLGVAWLWRRRVTRILALLAIGALGLVAGYVTYCRAPYLGRAVPVNVPVFRRPVPIAGPARAAHPSDNNPDASQAQTPGGR